ncbi:predicted protein [Phaeodactylum tricornutum CCAP 1055/1]|uniref:Uncharacterized protein n=1 Tax=Phaeodactylum tricornutum (strain CCAP 1055/1) TaxID=556484 RepID=B7FU74_PHATC|nr:predicted protein [Phaeodactylum tricornutum CCAP 1055/1]EEC50213.1 predicted protein [Phaeodactylum tricornutum CCAP 1055/1]|eukprot:XP_002178548.1 predicted protein [Phaeodactylum tricornutum CCAP 1055/1]
MSRPGQSPLSGERSHTKSAAQTSHAQPYLAKFGAIDHRHSNNKRDNPRKRFTSPRTPEINKRMTVDVLSTPKRSEVLSEEIDTRHLHSFGNASFDSKQSESTCPLAAPVTDDASDCGTEASMSSVAFLRSKLNNFGKQQREHYEKTSCKPEPSSLVKPTRSRVPRTTASSVPPTPLPPTSASALQKRLDAAHMARFRQTPIRIKPQVKNDDVQATNDGYASVAKLSKWLADDPTKVKQTIHLRRGANVIAKSRVFDKGLANVIVEDHRIRQGSVADKASMFASLKAHRSNCLSEDADETSSMISASHSGPVRQPPPPSKLEEDITPVDFQTARRKLVERSKDNGNDVSILSKVSRRKAKIETKEKEVSRRMSLAPQELLTKSSWDENSLGSYVKKSVPEEMAARKTLEELP